MRCPPARSSLRHLVCPRILLFFALLLSAALTSSSAQSSTDLCDSSAPNAAVPSVSLGTLGANGRLVGVSFSFTASLSNSGTAQGYAPWIDVVYAGNTSAVPAPGVFMTVSGVSFPYAGMQVYQGDFCAAGQANYPLCKSQTSTCIPHPLAQEMVPDPSDPSVFISVPQQMCAPPWYHYIVTALPLAGMAPALPAQSITLQASLTIPAAALTIASFTGAGPAVDVVARGGFRLGVCPIAGQAPTLSSESAATPADAWAVRATVTALLVQLSGGLGAASTPMGSLWPLTASFALDFSEGLLFTAPTLKALVHPHAYVLAGMAVPNTAGTQVNVTLGLAPSSPSNSSGVFATRWGETTVFGHGGQARAEERLNYYFSQPDSAGVGWIDASTGLSRAFDMQVTYSFYVRSLDWNVSEPALFVEVPLPTPFTSMALSQRLRKGQGTVLLNLGDQTGVTPRDVVQWVISLDVSEGFVLGDLVISDTMEDGQRWLRWSDPVATAQTVAGRTSKRPLLSCGGHGVLEFAEENKSLFVDESRVTDASLGRVGTTGQTIVRFNVTALLWNASAIVLPPSPVRNNATVAGPLIGCSIYYQTEVRQQFTDSLFTDGGGAVPERRFVAQGDLLQNSASLLAGATLRKSVNATNIVVGPSPPQNAQASVAVHIGDTTLAASWMGMSGVTTCLGSNNLGAGCPGLVVTPSDSVTLRIAYYLPADSFVNLQFKAFFPAPLTSITGLHAYVSVPEQFLNGTNTTDTSFGLSLAPYPYPLPPPVGYLAFGPQDSSWALNGIIPKVTTSAADNAVTVQYGTYFDAASRPAQIDLTLTVQMSAQRWADGQSSFVFVQAREHASTVFLGVPLTVQQPDVSIELEFIGIDRLGVTPIRNVAAPGQGVQGLFALVPGQNPIQAGDVLTMRIIVSNTGHAQAFGMILAATLPAHTELVPSSQYGGGAVAQSLGLLISPSVYNPTSTNGNGNFTTTHASLFNATTGLRFRDWNNTVAALPPRSSFVLTFQLRVLDSYSLRASSDAWGQSSITASMVSYSSIPSGPNHVHSQPLKKVAFTPLPVQFTVDAPIMSYTPVSSSPFKATIGEGITLVTRVVVPRGTNVWNVSLVTASASNLVLYKPGQISIVPDLFVSGTGLGLSSLIAPASVPSTNGGPHVLLVDLGESLVPGSAAAQVFEFRAWAVLANIASFVSGDTTPSVTFALPLMPNSSIPASVTMQFLIVEPKLRVVFSAVPAAVAGANVPVQVTWTVSHVTGAGASTSAAYNVLWNQAFDAGIATHGALSANLGATVLSGGASGNDALSAYLPVLQLGASWTLTYSMTLLNTVGSNSNVPLVSALNWTSVANNVLPSTPVDQQMRNYSLTAPSVGILVVDPPPAPTVTLISPATAYASISQPVVIEHRFQHPLATNVYNLTATLVSSVGGALALNQGMKFVSVQLYSWGSALTSSKGGGSAPDLTAQFGLDITDSNSDNLADKVALWFGTLFNSNTLPAQASQPSSAIVLRFTLAFPDINLNVNGAAGTRFSTQTPYSSSTGLSGVLSSPILSIELRNPVLLLTKSYSPLSAQAGDMINVTLTLVHATTPTPMPRAWAILVADEMMTDYMDVTSLPTTWTVTPTGLGNTGTIGPQGAQYINMSIPSLTSSTTVTLTYRVRLTKSVRPGMVLTAPARVWWDSIDVPAAGMMPRRTLVTASPPTGITIQAPTLGALTVLSSTSAPGIALTRLTLGTCMDARLTFIAIRGTQLYSEVRVDMPVNTAGSGYGLFGITRAVISYWGSSIQSPSSTGLREGSSANILNNAVATTAYSLPDRAVFTFGTLVVDPLTDPLTGNNNTIKLDLTFCAPLVNENYNTLLPTPVRTAPRISGQYTHGTNFSTASTSVANILLSPVVSMPIAEPRLAMTVSVGAPPTGDAGRTYTVTILVSHVATISSSPAYEVTIVSKLASKLQLQPGMTSTAPGVVTVGSTGYAGGQGNFTVKSSTYLAIASTMTITFQVIPLTTLLPAEVLGMSFDLSYTSGTNFAAPGASIGAGSAVVRARSYALSPSPTANVTSTINTVPLLPMWSSSNLYPVVPAGQITIGQRVTYQTRLQFNEGTTPQTVYTVDLYSGSGNTVPKLQAIGLTAPEFPSVIAAFGSGITSTGDAVGEGAALSDVAGPAGDGFLDRLVFSLGSVLVPYHMDTLDERNWIWTNISFVLADTPAARFGAPNVGLVAHNTVTSPNAVVPGSLPTSLVIVEPSLQLSFNAITDPDTSVVICSRFTAVVAHRTAAPGTVSTSAAFNVSLRVDNLIVNQQQLVVNSIRASVPITVVRGAGAGDTTTLVKLNQPILLNAAPVNVSFYACYNSALPPQATQPVTTLLDYSSGDSVVLANFPPRQYPSSSTAEPFLNAVLSANVSSGDASKVIHYTYVITHVANSTALAFDVHLNFDTLLQNKILLRTGSVRSDWGTIVEGNTNGDTRVRISVSVYPLVDATITVTFDADISATLLPTDKLRAESVLTYRNAPDGNDPPVVRTSTIQLTAIYTAVFVYTLGAPYVFASSVPASVAPWSDILIGELFTYRVLLTLPAGTSPSLNLTVLLAADASGAQMRALDSAVVSGGVGAALSIERLPALQVAGGSASNAQLVAPQPSGLADTVRFELGTVVNTPTVSGNTLLLEVRALLVDRPTVRANIGQQTTVRAQLDSSNPVQTTQLVQTVVEPVLHFASVAVQPTPARGNASAIFTFTASIEHLPNSTAAGFQVNVTTSNLAASKLRLLTNTVTASIDGNTLVAALDGSGAELSVRLLAPFARAPSGPLLVSFDAQLTDALQPEDVLYPAIDLQWASSPLSDAGPTAWRPAHLREALAIYSDMQFGAGFYVNATSLPQTSALDLAVGEQIDYVFTVLLPQGTTPDVNLTVALPAGLSGTAALQVESARVLSVGAQLVCALCSVDASASLVQSGGVPTSAVFYLGTVVNHGDQVINGSDYLSVRVLARVRDVPANAPNVPVPTTALYSFGYGAPQVYTLTGRVVEPFLNGTLVASASSGDAATVLSYTFTLQHAGNSSSSAYDTQLSFDELLQNQLSVVSGSVHCTAPFGFTVQSGNSDEAVLSVLFPRLDLGQTAQCTFQARIAATLKPSETLVTQPRLELHSMPDWQGNPSARRYVQLPQPTYYTAVFVYTLGAPYVFASSVPASVAPWSDILIGELFTYRVLLTLPAGTSPSLNLTVLLAADASGAQMRALDSAVVSGGVGAALSIERLPALQVAGGSASNAQLVAPQPSGLADTVRFELGTVVNTPTVSGNTLLLEVRALLVDRPTVRANIGQQTTVRAQLDSSNPVQTTQLVQTVVEPVLHFASVAVQPTPARGNASAIFTFTASIEHLPNSTAAGFQVNVTTSNLAASKLRLLTNTVTASIDGNTLVAALDGSGAELSVRLLAPFARAPSGPLLVSFDAQLTDALQPEDVLYPAIDLQWASSPLSDAGPTAWRPAHLREALAIYSDMQFGAGFYVNATSLPQTSALDLAVGEQIDYVFTVLLPQGTTPDVNLTVALPAGLSGTAALQVESARVLSVGAQLVCALCSVDASASLVQSGGVPTSAVFYLGTVVNHGDQVINGSDYLSVRVLARVRDVPANAPNVPVPTTALYSFGYGAPQVYTLTGRVVEPFLNGTLVASASSGDAATVLSYTFTLQHAGNSSSSAYDTQLSFDELLQNKLHPVPGSVRCSVPPNPASLVGNSSGDAVIDMVFPFFDFTAASLTCSFKVQIDSSLQPLETLYIRGKVKYFSARPHVYARVRSIEWELTAIPAMRGFPITDLVAKKGPADGEVLLTFTPPQPPLATPVTGFFVVDRLTQAVMYTVSLDQLSFNPYNTSEFGVDVGTPESPAPLTFLLANLTIGPPGYEFVVHSVTAVGSSLPSNVAPYIATTLPGSVSGVTLLPSNASMTVQFQYPYYSGGVPSATGASRETITFVGGTPIVRYDFIVLDTLAGTNVTHSRRPDEVGAANAMTLSVTFAPLRNGVNYTVTIVAINAVGASVPVTSESLGRPLSAPIVQPDFGLVLSNSTEGILLAVLLNDWDINYGGSIVPVSLEFNTSQALLGSIVAESVPSEQGGMGARYIPTSNHAGKDVIAYRICNNYGQCSWSRVEITVLYTSPTIVVTPKPGNDSDYFSDLPTGKDLTIVIVVPPTYGSAVLVLGPETVMTPSGPAPRVQLVYKPSGFCSNDSVVTMTCDSNMQCYNTTVQFDAPCVGKVPLPTKTMVGPLPALAWMGVSGFHGFALPSGMFSMVDYLQISGDSLFVQQDQPLYLEEFLSSLAWTNFRGPVPWEAPGGVPSAIETTLPSLGDAKSLSVTPVRPMQLMARNASQPLTSSSSASRSLLNVDDLSLRGRTIPAFLLWHQLFWVMVAFLCVLVLLLVVALVSRCIESRFGALYRTHYFVLSLFVRVGMLAYQPLAVSAFFALSTFWSPNADYLALGSATQRTLAGATGIIVLAVLLAVPVALWKMDFHRGFNEQLALFASPQEAARARVELKANKKAAKKVRARQQASVVQREESDERDSSDDNVMNDRGFVSPLPPPPPSPPAIPAPPEADAEIEMEAPSRMVSGSPSQRGHVLRGGDSNDHAEAQSPAAISPIAASVVAASSGPLVQRQSHALRVSDDEDDEEEHDQFNAEVPASARVGWRESTPTPIAGDTSTLVTPLHARSASAADTAISPGAPTVHSFSASQDAFVSSLSSSGSPDNGGTVLSDLGLTSAALDALELDVYRDLNKASNHARPNLFLVWGALYNQYKWSSKWFYLLVLARQICVGAVVGLLWQKPSAQLALLVAVFVLYLLVLVARRPHLLRFHFLLELCSLLPVPVFLLVQLLLQLDYFSSAHRDDTWLVVLQFHWVVMLVLCVATVPNLVFAVWNLLQACRRTLRHELVRPESRFAVMIDNSECRVAWHLVDLSQAARALAKGETHPEHALFERWFALRNVLWTLHLPKAVDPAAALKLQHPETQSGFKTAEEVVSEAQEGDMGNVIAGTASARARAPNPITLAGLAASAFGENQSPQPMEPVSPLSPADASAVKSLSPVNEAAAAGKAAAAPALASSASVEKLLEHAEVVTATPPKTMLPPLALRSHRGGQSSISGVQSISSLHSRVHLGPALRAIVPAEEVALEESQDMRRKLILRDRELNSVKAYAMRGSVLVNTASGGIGLHSDRAKTKTKRASATALPLVLSGPAAPAAATGSVHNSRTSESFLDSPDVAAGTSVDAFTASSSSGLASVSEAFPPVPPKDIPMAPPVPAHPLDAAHQALQQLGLVSLRSRQQMAAVTSPPAQDMDTAAAPAFAPLPIPPMHVRAPSKPVAPAHARAPSSVAAPAHARAPSSVVAPAHARTPSKVLPPPPPSIIRPPVPTMVPSPSASKLPLPPLSIAAPVSRSPSRKELAPLRPSVSDPSPSPLPASPLLPASPSDAVTVVAPTGSPVVVGVDVTLDVAASPVASPTAAAGKRKYKLASNKSSARSSAAGAAAVEAAATVLSPAPAATE